MEELDERIAVRTRAMMDGGLIEEVRALIDVGLREAKTASRATGYAQALAVIDGQMSEDEAVESIALATRQLARRRGRPGTLVTRSAAALQGDGGYGGAMMNTQLPAHARVVKAHGAGNSFVVATDQYDDYDPSEAEVATLCSPAFGIGADGFIRAVERDGLWFMDYRNADGSKAEMCGNGVRGGIWVDMPNPHTVVELADEETLREVFLPTVDVSQIPQAQRPSYEPAPQAGTNLELVVDLTEPGGERGHIAMRVLERGVGETQACGTGCCAAALATALRRGPGTPTQWVVDIPGGTVIVGLDGVIDWSGESPRITDASVFLTGPATRVADIRLS